MSKSNTSKSVVAAGRVLLAYALVFTQSAWAGQDQKTKDKLDSAQKASTQQTQVKQPPVPLVKARSVDAQSTAQERNAEEETNVSEERSSGDGSHEGIKVHGHWTIEVRNPDGRLVAHREFENSLAGGGQLLSALLYCLHVAVPTPPSATWAIRLFGSPAPCSNSISGGCEISQGPNLKISLPGVGQPNQGAFVLSGSITATTSSSITSIVTAVFVNAPGTGPSNGVLNFTGTQLQTQVSVGASQIIQVSVVISFS